MNAAALAVSALILYVAGVVAAFGWRTWRHYRRTGSTGFNGFSGRPGSLEWWAGRLFTLAVLAGLAAPILALTDAVQPARFAGSAALGTLGLALMLAGFVATLAAQAGMGTSWRIGVDEGERTELVTSGVFALVRNPIFTAMLTAQLGLALAVPGWVSLTALLGLLLAVEVQVRRIEEPYLLRNHPVTYPAYGARTGRFLPGLGRLHPATGHPITSAPTTDATTTDGAAEHGR
ncbi:isoprenylcysteine carboxylmethyltransferase family protein [Kineococcus sp. NUM-3379]